MLSRLITIPFAIITIVLLILSLQRPELSLFMIPPILVLATVYVLHPEIDWWWYQQHPPKMPQKEQAFLERFSPFYRRLNDSDRQRFRNRSMMIRLAKDFMAQAAEKDLPEDIRLVFAASQAQATFGMEDYLLLHHEKVVIYPGPFPSPKYPQHFHASETFEEAPQSGYIFSLKHALAGFMQPQQHYPVVLHEICQSLTLQYPDRSWPTATEASWPLLETISGFPTAALKKAINRPDLEPLATMLTYFLSFPEKFQASQAELYAQCALALELDPLAG